MTERVTVTLPSEILREIERFETNRSRFVLDAVRHELQRRQREELRRSFESPHPEGQALAEAGFDEWARGLPHEDTDTLIDLNSGTPVRWIPGEGWREEPA